MSFGKLALKAALAASIAAAPTVVHAAGAAEALSLSQTRASADLQAENGLGGGFLIPLLALGAIILGVLTVIEDDEDAVSP